MEHVSVFGETVWLVSDGVMYIGVPLIFIVGFLFGRNSVTRMQTTTERSEK